MENIKKHEKSKKYAIGLLIFLVVFVVSVQLLLFICYKYFEENLEKRNENMQNIRTKLEIQYMIKNGFLSYQSQIRSMMFSNSIEELSEKRLKIFINLQDINNYIYILKNGGTLDSIQGGGIIEYQKKTEDESKYDFLGLIVRLNVLKEISQELFDLIIVSKFVQVDRDFDKDIIQKVNTIYMNMEPILQRALKETDKMYLDGQIELENVVKDINRYKIIYEIIFVGISAFNILLTLFIGYLISRNIYKIIDSRDQALHLLEMNRANLESIVKERTKELSRINEALNDEIKKKEEAEKALHKSNTELEQRVKERTMHLEEEILNRKIAEMELRKFRLAVEQNPASIVITDPTGIIEYVNPAFEKISGYSISEVIGKKPSLLNSGMNSREKYDDMWRTISGGNPWRGEFINRSKNGEIYTEHVVIAPIKNSEGVITNYVGIKEDITDLIKAREEAERANKAKSDFLANISHEIRTPMNGIIGFIDLLKSTDLTEKQRKFVDIISNSSQNLLSIINDILDYSKIESGKITLDLEYEDLKTKVESTIELFSAKGLEKSIDILFYFDVSIPERIRCDILRINQILSNLIGNAIKFTPEGGKIFVKIVKKYIDQKVVRLFFSVRDTGIGIPKEKQEKIFQAFSQAEDSTTKKYGGTGLGLTIASQLVAAMGGKIVLDSEEGKGSEFSFELDFQYEGEHINRHFSESISAVIISPFNVNEDETILIAKEYLENFGVKPVLTNLDDIDTLSNNADVYIFHYNRSSHEKIKMLSSCYTPSIVILNSLEEESFSSSKDNPSPFLIFKPLNPSKIFDALNNIFSKKISDIALDRRSSDSCFFNGKRILVAEDNPVNQELIEIILKEMGFDVDIADNGLIALDKIEKNFGKYDIIMLDINMPELDGFGVLERIKGIDDIYKKTPIIAVTAHAGKSDIDRILERGFNAYIPKPFTLNILEQTLKRFIKGENINEGKKQIPTATEKKYSINELAKQINMDPKIYMKLLKKYTSTTESHIVKLKESINKDNREELSMIAHSIKGASLNLSLKRLSDIAYNLEKNAANMSVSQIDIAIKELEESFKKLKNDIEGDLL